MRRFDGVAGPDRTGEEHAARFERLGHVVRVGRDGQVPGDAGQVGRCGNLEGIPITAVQDQRHRHPSGDVLQLRRCPRGRDGGQPAQAAGRGDAAVQNGGKARLVELDHHLAAGNPPPQIGHVHQDRLGQGMGQVVDERIVPHQAAPGSVLDRRSPGPGTADLDLQHPVGTAQRLLQPVAILAQPRPGAAHVRTHLTGDLPARGDSRDREVPGHRRQERGSTADHLGTGAASG